LQRRTEFRVRVRTRNHQRHQQKCSTEQFNYSKGLQVGYIKRLAEVLTSSCSEWRIRSVSAAHSFLMGVVTHTHTHTHTFSQEELMPAGSIAKHAEPFPSSWCSSIIISLNCKLSWFSLWAMVIYKRVYGIFSCSSADFMLTLQWWWSWMNPSYPYLWETWNVNIEVNFIMKFYAIKILHFCYGNKWLNK